MHKGHSRHTTGASQRAQSKRGRDRKASLCDSSDRGDKKKKVKKRILTPASDCDCDDCIKYFANLRHRHAKGLDLIPVEKMKELLAMIEKGQASSSRQHNGGYDDHARSNNYASNSDRYRGGYQKNSYDDTRYGPPPPPQQSERFRGSASRECHEDVKMSEDGRSSSGYGHTRATFGGDSGPPGSSRQFDRNTGSGRGGGNSYNSQFKPPNQQQSRPFGGEEENRRSPNRPGRGYSYGNDQRTGGTSKEPGKNFGGDRNEFNRNGRYGGGDNRNTGPPRSDGRGGGGGGNRNSHNTWNNDSRDRGFNRRDRNENDQAPLWRATGNDEEESREGNDWCANDDQWGKTEKYEPEPILQTTECSPPLDLPKGPESSASCDRRPSSEVLGAPLTPPQTAVHKPTFKPRPRAETEESSETSSFRLPNGRADDNNNSQPPPSTTATYAEQAPDRETSNKPSEQPSNKPSDQPDQLNVSQTGSPEDLQGSSEDGEWREESTDYGGNNEDEAAGWAVTAEDEDKWSGQQKVDASETTKAFPPSDHQDVPLKKQQQQSEPLEEPKLSTEPTWAPAAENSPPVERLSQNLTGSEEEGAKDQEEPVTWSAG